MRIQILALSGLLVSGCVLDRTGQSASEAYRRELALQTIRITNLEAQFDALDLRVSQVEELNQVRGQEEIRNMESIDELQAVLASMRGELETLNHTVGQQTQGAASQAEDAAYRLQWLESRADAMEKSMGLSTPAPPSSQAEPGTEEAVADAAGEMSAEEDGAAAPVDAGLEEITDPEQMIALAEEHLAAGRERAAEVILDRFVGLHPKHKRMAEVLYRRAEARFNAGDYASAVLKFQEVIDNHRSSVWASWAMLRQGESFDNQGQKGNARLFYEDVVRMWPKSKAAKEAKAKLAK